MNATKIEWVKNPDGSQGYTWNPITGCLNGCSYCYARKLAEGRLRQRYLANENTIMRFSDGYAPMKLKVTDPFYPRFWEDRYLDFTTKRIRHHYRGRRGIFVCDMSDLFGIGIPEEWAKKVLEATAYYPSDRFYLLTKQPQNLIKFSPFSDNCWVGVTATDPTMFAEACYRLKRIEAKVKYISLEPLLDFQPDLAVLTWGRWIYDWLLIGSIDWVIIGAQTKPTVYPKIEWVEEIVRACDKAGVPVFLKDNLKPILPPFGNELFPPAIRVRQEIPK